MYQSGRGVRKTSRFAPVGQTLTQAPQRMQPRPPVGQTAAQLPQSVHPAPLLGGGAHSQAISRCGT